ncbi:hypothetical protein A3J17_04030 [Candidatus Curtissbacteria bacterium RIFCSPLOWO2_02_FULL_40_11]|uniref:SHS2 domain-containing protein n=1 Tax=Candidatus Curtissbacteria bacterium RIFCSPHIGHO2_02_FULL_40_16b TaxID=1797714 RepID=A0A1F5G6F8_9BACT|nr:MAG: hypothetical protein A3D04_00015 [Candidatus Curtissbacteria bacterium RIFCSPHIGHO2_02_FULL_40_16b]OGE00695.1 MAG: hypothetical protein A3J17_04030 [Candidatus Curtissbacteria bacterium RIFCSPLOWO2_02_FULL_40_11]
MAAQIFGLDIGRSFIKVVQVKISGSSRSLVAVGSAATPGAGLRSEVKPELKQLAETIKTLVKNSKIHSNKCTVSIVEAQAVTRLIELPNLTDKELSAAINFEADQYIPLPIKDVNLQYKVLSRPQPGSGGKMAVLLVAAPKRVIEKYLEVVKMSGFSLSAVETESSSLARALSNKNDPPSLIVSMGASSTELVLIKEGNVFFTRSIASGGAALTKAIMTEFNLASKQAEEYKMAYGILEDKLSGKISRILRPVLEVVTTEILKAIDYARSHMGDQRLSGVVICGGSAYLPGLAEFVTEKTSVEVSLGDPWANFAKEGLILKMPGQGSFYSIATGLALRT